MTVRAAPLRHIPAPTPQPHGTPLLSSFLGGVDPQHHNIENMFQNHMFRKTFNLFWERQTTFYLSPPGSFYFHCTQTVCLEKTGAGPAQGGSPRCQGLCPLCLPVSPACLPAPRGGGYSQESHTPSCGPLLNPLILMKTCTHGLWWTEWCFPAEPVDRALFGKRAFADIIKSRLSRGAHPGLGP